MPSARLSSGTNAAAWITAPKASPFEVKEAPYPSAGPNEVIVETAVVAINPLEFKIQDTNPPIGGREIQYPTILGADLAGTIVAVGDAVADRKVGDRVIANANGAQTGRPAMSAFQHFVKLEEGSTTPIPDFISFEAASVLPLACDTAAAGLFVDKQLGLSTSKLGDVSAQPPAPGSAVLVWGGSSSVGCCAIQMAHAAGYEVYTTASKRNHQLCSSIGAEKVFDHSDPQVVEDIVIALKGKKVIGALDCIVDAEKTIPPLGQILAQTEGQKKIAAVLNPPDVQLPEGVQAQRLSIPALRQSNTYDIIHAWMPKALANGTLQPKPDPWVIGEGLEFVQQGVDTVRKGVSATKIVVKL
ncbi:Zinc-binding alcohol dehydrogenase domain-containing cipB [Lecanosticta acicola]|uniref:Zinc-binding alcohol dehydrogenase domain-containing cipB n=1 Tax=Lecanosticta acicola TaxID=111012 RepID=A0AAI8Z9R0_9PEZI|nr:Zinc-binding alcohol dehydrogenase domain-containing cipB [Lecanosticta acicola]